jgi:hypothetical protein
MDWQYLMPKIAKSTTAALVLATLINFTSPVHFLIAAAVLLLAWPVTDIIIESIASKNPSAGERIIVKRWWPTFMTIGLVFIVSGGLWLWLHLPFMTAFAYSLLGLSAVGAINGILMECEDNAPGGWLNPKNVKNEKGKPNKEDSPDR